MQLDEQRPRRTRINWVQGNLQYILAWNGPENGPPPIHHDFVTFTCATYASVCTSWTVTPGTEGGTGLAGLYSIPTKGNATETYLGSYTMPFSITLTKQ
jgi:hypothetical protein